jgi:hypothetical protein
MIKPCPFCNSEAKLKVTEDNSDYCFEKTTGKIKQYYDIRCTNDACYLCDGADWNQSRPEDIIELWNTRNKQKEREDKLNELGI